MHIVIKRGFTFTILNNSTFLFNMKFEDFSKRKSVVANFLRMRVQCVNYRRQMRNEG